MEPQPSKKRIYSDAEVRRVFIDENIHPINQHDNRIANTLVMSSYALVSSNNTVMIHEKIFKKRFGYLKSLTVGCFKQLIDPCPARKVYTYYDKLIIISVSGNVKFFSPSKPAGEYLDIKGVRDVVFFQDEERGSIFNFITYKNELQQWILGDELIQHPYVLEDIEFVTLFYDNYLTIVTCDNSMLMMNGRLVCDDYIAATSLSLKVMAIHDEHILMTNNNLYNISLGDESEDERSINVEMCLKIDGVIHDYILTDYHLHIINKKRRWITFSLVNYCSKDNYTTYMRFIEVGNGFKHLALPLNGDYVSVEYMRNKTKLPFEPYYEDKLPNELTPYYKKLSSSMSDPQKAKFESLKKSKKAASENIKSMRK
jgi:hypothetical protein